MPLANCDMTPVSYKIPLAAKGIAPMDKATRCGPVNWRLRARSGSYEVMVSDSLGAGNGQTWDIAVAVKSPEAGVPMQGVCLNAETRGWKTLREFEGAALPWLEDVDKNGQTEVILWRSFPATDKAPRPDGSDEGLMGWVYFVDNDDLVLDDGASKLLAARLVKAYRKPVSDAKLRKTREEAARRLERFVRGSCLPIR